ncbi:peptide-methionine (S)-S-oxide reductase activity [Mayamaea pseudoterrestris]|nr:peptide-methionine (S)-S-oxide reductase activity [Mayamaea pseudoterrestris]
MALKKLQVTRAMRFKKARKHIDSSWGSSKSSMKSFVGKLSLSNLRSSLHGSMTTLPPPTTIQCGLSDSVSPFVALAAGPYCNVESMILREFASVRRPGAVRFTRAGFMSPYYHGHGSASDDDDEQAKLPTYEQVMSGTSGHVMVVFVELADPVNDFEDLIRFFFQIHDPTTKYRQGNHRGFQYASWIFCGDQEQYNVAKKVRMEAQELLDHGLLRECYNARFITTNMSLMSEFIPGPEEHQQYLIKNSLDAAQVDDDCMSAGNRMRFESWPSLGPDDASSISLGSVDESEDRIEASIRSSAHFRQRESLVHTMLRISMCDTEVVDEEKDGSIM